MVVSNASPLIILARLSLFDLLQRVFGNITISQEVWDEVVINGSGLPGSSETHHASQSGWIRVVQVLNTQHLIQWQTNHSLGAGEVSTILIAKEINASIALIDERQARLLAHTEGVSVLGTVGFLELAYHRGEIADLRSSYQTMIAKGARIDLRILNQSLASFDLPEL